mmetsp:Transcript_9442/g.8981  ORF Transcript_9442/g.8981 Transcript_9442/m.8981 type:complete len:609 (+) Transcript_9442:2746-4572(+)
MAAPSTSIDGVTGDVIITWVQPDSNGQAITAYVIQIKDGTSTPQTNSECDGSDQTIIDNLSCTVPMTEFTSTLSISVTDLIEVTVAAVNSEGTGDTSPYNTDGATAAQAPNAPAAPTSGSATSSSQIQVDWVDLTGTDTGGSAITSYALYWDNNSGTADILLADSLILTYTVTGLTAGNTYKFLVKAKNLYGTSAASASVDIDAEGTPGTVSTPVITLAGSNTDLIATWSALSDTGGLTIDAYDVEIYNPAASTFSVDLTLCNGPTLVGTETCTMDMASLISSHGYLYGDILGVRVRAHNSIGYGAFSPVSVTGAFVQGLPQYMHAPTLDAYTATSLDIVWEALTDTQHIGALAITNYELWGGPAGSLVQLQVANSLTYSDSSLTPGATYEYKVRAYNSLGWGPYSSITQMVPLGVPDKLADAVISVVGSNLKIAFSVPVSNGGATVDSYDIQIQLQGTTTYQQDLTYCDGSSATIMSQMYCMVPMTEIISTYGYTYNQLVVAIVSASNSVGAGDFSDDNTIGDTVITPPDQVATPTDGAGTTQSSIQVDWADYPSAPENGGSSVTSYNVQWDSGTGGVTWTNLAGFSTDSLALTYTVTSGVVPGTSY